MATGGDYKPDAADALRRACDKLNAELSLCAEDLRVRCGYTGNLLLDASEIIDEPTLEAVAKTVRAWADALDARVRQLTRKGA